MDRLATIGRTGDVRRVGSAVTHTRAVLEEATERTTVQEALANARKHASPPPSRCDSARGGDVELTSPPGRGTRVAFSVPLSLARH